MTSTEDTKAPGFFSPMTQEEMDGITSALEVIQAIKEGADQIPSELRQSLEGASDDLLRGYLIGSMHTSQAIAAMMQAASSGDDRSAGIIRLRQDIITYLVCRQLTSGGSRIILPS